MNGSWLRGEPADSYNAAATCLGYRSMRFFQEQEQSGLWLVPVKS
jgi:hypothetical protein